MSEHEISYRPSQFFKYIVCPTDHSCENGGTCSYGICSCKDGFGGVNCGNAIQKYQNINVNLSTYLLSRSYRVVKVHIYFQENVGLLLYHQTHARLTLQAWKDVPSQKLIMSFVKPAIGLVGQLVRATSTIVEKMKFIQLVVEVPILCLIPVSK